VPYGVIIFGRTGAQPDSEHLGLTQGPAGLTMAG
jgi:hypothetical protein